MLVGATGPNMTAAYAYDSDNRRTKKTVNGVVTRTLWSGADELAELEGSGTTLRRFVPDGSGAMDARLATVEANGDVYWLHTDHQGSVIATSNSSGQVVEAVGYSPYGEFAAGQTAPPAHSPFGYTGRQYDPETGLYQYRARYYSPRLGVFLSTDPIGTKDDPNLHMYVGLDPVDKIDPSGLSDLNYFHPGDNLYDEGEEFDIFGMFTITGHGNPSGIEDNRNRAGSIHSGAILSMSTLQRDMISSGYVRGSGQMIFVGACEFGSSSLAGQLARWANAYVWATSDYVVYGDRGAFNSRSHMIAMRANNSINADGEDTTFQLWGPNGRPVSGSNFRAIVYDPQRREVHYLGMGSPGTRIKRNVVCDKDNHCRPS